MSAAVKFKLRGNDFFKAGRFKEYASLRAFLSVDLLDLMLRQSIV